MKSPSTAMEEQPPDPLQLEKSPCGKEDSAQSKINNFFKFIKFQKNFLKNAALAKNHDSLLIRNTQNLKMSF